MDAHIRWLRRRVITGVGGRILLEFLLVATLAAGALAAADGGAAVTGDLAQMTVAALACGLVLVCLRLAWALATNPINNRYLLAWTDPSLELQPAPVLDASAAAPSEAGLSFAIRMADPTTGQSIDVHRSDRGSTVLTSVDGDRGPTVISRLSDGRLLVTSAGLVPPFGSVVVNRCLDVDPAGLLRSHNARLDDLANRGLRAVRTDNHAVTEQLHLEWRSWDQIGPFLGPFVAVDHHRRPLAIQVRIDRDSLWSRTVGARATLAAAAAPDTVAEPAPAASPIVETPIPGPSTDHIGPITTPRPAIWAAISDPAPPAQAAEVPQPEPSPDRPTAPPPSPPVHPGGPAQTS